MTDDKISEWMRKHPTSEEAANSFRIVFSGRIPGPHEFVIKDWAGQANWWQEPVKKKPWWRRIFGG